MARNRGVQATRLANSRYRNPPWKPHQAQVGDGCDDWRLVAMGKSEG